MYNFQPLPAFVAFFIAFSFLHQADFHRVDFRITHLKGVA